MNDYRLVQFKDRVEIQLGEDNWECKCSHWFSSCECWADSEYTYKVVSAHKTVKQAKKALRDLQLQEGIIL